MGFAQRIDIVTLTKLAFCLQVPLSAPCMHGEGPANPNVLCLSAPLCQQGIEPRLPDTESWASYERFGNSFREEGG
jgi:hypothetical protein